MLEEVAIQREVVLRWLDRRFAAVLFLERRLEAVFVMIGNLPWTAPEATAANQKLSGPSYVCAPGGRDSFQVGQTAKARSGYRVHSLHIGRDRQCRFIVIECSPLNRPRLYVLWDARMSGLEKCSTARNTEGSNGQRGRWQRRRIRSEVGPLPRQ